MDNTDIFDSVDQETHAFLCGRISDIFRGTYELELVSFMVWFFDNRSNFGEYVNSTLLVIIEEVDVIQTRLGALWLGGPARNVCPSVN